MMRRSRRKANKALYWCERDTDSSSAGESHEAGKRASSSEGKGNGDGSIDGDGSWRHAVLIRAFLGLKSLGIALR